MGLFDIILAWKHHIGTVRRVLPQSFFYRIDGNRVFAVRCTKVGGAGLGRNRANAAWRTTPKKVGVVQLDN